FQFIEPSEQVLATARAFADSPDENRRSVAKALLDVTAAGRTIREAMQENRGADLAPYFDFWFADAVACAQRLLQEEEPESRHLAQCLIESEKAILQSKERFLAEVKRHGIRPQHE